MAQTPIIAIGASSGGVPALRALVGGLPATLAAPVLVVLHIGANRSALPALLAAAGPLPASHASDGEALRPGHIHIAPPDRHMTVADGRLRLSRGPKENCARPAIDPLFRSVAASHGPRAIGLVLTGNLNDGAQGLFEIKRRGGTAIAQDPDDAAYPEMPLSAAAHVALDHCLPLAAIPALLVRLAGGKEEMDMPMPPRPATEQPSPGDRSFDRPLTVTCPDCGGALRTFRQGQIVKFGCHIGHSYTAEIMARAHFEEMERVMRAAVRFLNERAEFCLWMAERDDPPGRADSADWHAASRQALDRAYRLRDLVEQDWLMPEAPDRPRQRQGSPSLAD